MRRRPMGVCLTRGRRTHLNDVFPVSPHIRRGGGERNVLVKPVDPPDRQEMVSAVRGGIGPGQLDEVVAHHVADRNDMEAV
jgi:hypothetical protein